jgi:hypothetical protein
MNMIGMPNDLMALLASAQPAATDPRLEAIKAAMGKRVPMPRPRPTNMPGGPDYEYEGGAIGDNYNNQIPTPNDLLHMRNMGATDGNLADSFATFPKYIAEDVKMQGGNPMYSPDQYAMDDEEWAQLHKDRSTMIDPDSHPPRTTTYEEQPGEDRAERMAADAVQGNGVEYPSNGRESQADRHTNSLKNGVAKEMQDDATDWLAGQGLTDRQFIAKYGEHPRDVLIEMGIDEDELPDEEEPNAYQPKGADPWEPKGGIRRRFDDAGR